MKKKGIIDGQIFLAMQKEIAEQKAEIKELTKENNQLTTDNYHNSSNLEIATREIKELKEVLRMDEAFSLYHVLDKLTEASNILLHEKNYDGHGWEIIEKCVTEAEAIKNLISKK